MPLISFLIPARQRRQDLQRLADYFVAQALAIDCEVIVIVERNWIEEVPVESLLRSGARLLLVDGEGDIFHKTRLLNIGLAAALGEYVVAYDSDLLPLFPLTVLSGLLQGSPALILGGYRIMSGHIWAASDDPPSLAPASSDCASADRDSRHPAFDDGHMLLARPASAPEDCAGALYKQLLAGERFMVCPVFRRDLLADLAGWNEAYHGWGCEDQDILERYVAASGLLAARLPDLLYLHFDHPDQSGWNEAALVERNRAYYYGSR